MEKTNKYTLSSGVHDTKGRRQTMEDTHVVLDNVEIKDSDKQVAYYGCFDGHGGTETAQMIGEILHTTVFNRQEFLDGNVEGALEKAFEEADKVVVAHALENNYMNGCTAVVGLIVDGVLHVANLGDSEAILVSVDGEKVVCENLTFSHKASVPSEKARIESLGGYVFFNRVFGSLAVSRAFGDSKYKQPKTTQNYVSFMPAIKTVQLNSCHRYLLLACDGLWDVCTHDEVAQIVHEQFAAGKSSSEIASFLCTEAIRKRSEDNVTVIVAKIDWETSNHAAAGQITNEEKEKTSVGDKIEEDKHDDPQETHAPTNHASSEPDNVPSPEPQTELLHQKNDNNIEFNNNGQDLSVENI